MPVRLVDSASAPESSGFGKTLHIGLINNMPDPALKATERQFRSLLEAASGDIQVHLSLFALPSVPRGETGLRHMASYLDIETLWNSRLDGLIVTGTEPRAADLRDEPYWDALAKVIDWAELNTRSTVWSCLAAHAAILHLDGIPRRRFAQKHCGVFECDLVSNHELLAGIESPLRVPHSRWNDIPAAQLSDAGYSALTRPAGGGVDAFVRERNSLFLFFQGHPEYHADTLLLEYRRDVGRYVKGESQTYPALPEGYFNAETTNLLAGVRERIVSERTDDSLAHFPITLLSAKVANTWRPSSTRIYRNWLEYQWTQKERALSAPPVGVRNVAESPESRLNLR